MLKIRLTRVGKKKQPHYRVVIAEHSAPIKGKNIEIVGNYNPFTKKFIFNLEKIKYWLSKGAKPSNTVAKLLNREGIKHKSIKIKFFKAKSKTEIEKEKKIKEEEKAKEQAVKEAKKAEFETKQPKEKEEKNIETEKLIKEHNPNQAENSPDKEISVPNEPADAEKAKAEKT